MSLLMWARIIKNIWKNSRRESFLFRRGELLFNTGTENISRSGEMIFEFMYPGETFEGHM